MTKKDNKTSFNHVNERMKYKYRFHCDHTGSIADAIHDVLKQIGEVNNV